MLKDWCTDNKLISMHQDIIKIIEMAALIPPSTAEVERSFSVMNLVSNLCVNVYQMKICAIVWGYVNFHEVLPRMIINKSYRDGWKVLEPNQKAVESIIVYRTKKKRTFSTCILIFICIQHVRRKKPEEIVLMFFYFMYINPVAIFSFFSRVLNFWSQGISWNTKAIF